MKHRPGLAHFVFIVGVVVVALAALSIVTIVKPTSPFAPSVTPTPTLSPTPYPTSTPTLTPSPTPSPTPVITPTSTPRPTQPPVSGPPGSGYSRITVATPKGNFSASVLSLDLSTTKVITDTASDSDCSNSCPVMPLKDYVTRNGGFAGVNGTYFCPDTYPECSGKTNSFDFPVYNTRLNKWMQADKLGWGGRAIIYFDGSGGHYHQNSAGFGGGLNAGIINYPGLVSDGNVQIDENQSGLSDKQKAKGTKVGIGIRGTQNVMVVIASNVNMHEFAHVFKSLGATGALNLDSGGSTALYYNNYIYGPGRSLPNAIVFARR